MFDALELGDIEYANYVGVHEKSTIATITFYELFIPLKSHSGFAIDLGYDQREFIAELRQMEITPHVAQNQSRRRSRLDQRTTRHPGYEVSQRKRKRIEEVFGWMKTVGLLRKLRHRGLERVG